MGTFGKGKFVRDHVSFLCIDSISYSITCTLLGSKLLLYMKLASALCKLNSMTSTLNLRNDTLIKKKMLEIKEDYMDYIFRC
jgi:hypothetical protein